MARTPGSIKAETHERIVQTAARAIREHGYDGASVADVMKQAGLTHGGFYAHFESREAMVEQALEHAASESRARILGVAERAEPAHALEAMVASYLSDRHVEHPESGCTLAALGSETARQSPAVRRAATRQIASFARLLAQHMPGGADDAENGERALAALSSMIGALVISRIVDDPGLSRAVRAAAAREIAGDGAVPRARAPRSKGSSPGELGS